MSEQLLPLALAVVAFLYGSVGHAGATGYIAVFALAGLAPELIRPLALMLNLLVASFGAWQFWRAGHLHWRRFWPLLPLAVPAAFWGDGWMCQPEVCGCCWVWCCCRPRFVFCCVPRIPSSSLLPIASACWLPVVVWGSWLGSPALVVVYFSALGWCCGAGAAPAKPPRLQRCSS